MAQPYRELFAAPGTRGFALAGLLARIPLPMIGIGIITMLSQLRGSYALAGAVSASFVLTYALVSPLPRSVTGMPSALPACVRLAWWGTAWLRGHGGGNRSGVSGDRRRVTALAALKNELEGPQ